jgi:hypothetical protein
VQELENAIDPSAEGGVVRLLFATYLLVSVAGLAVFVTVGLLGR